MTKWGNCAAVSYGKNKGWTCRAPMKPRKPYQPYKRPGAPLRRGPLRGPSTAMRTGRSYTRTATKQKKKKSHVVTHGDNSSASYNSIGGGFRSRTINLINKKLVSPQTIYFNDTTFDNGATGLQSIYVYPIMTKTQLTAIKTTVAGGATNNNVKMFLRKGKQTFRFRNATNTVARCTIYDIVTKRNVVDLGGATTNDPQIAWRKGLTDAGALANGQLKVGMTPHRSPEFHRYFAINKVTSVSLEAGQEHQHKIKHTWNKIVNSVQFENETQEGVAGLTRYIMLVWHGTLVHGTDNVVSYAPCKLDMALEHEYTFGWLEKQVPSYTQTNNLATTLLIPTFMGESGDNDQAMIAS